MPRLSKRSADHAEASLAPSNKKSSRRIKSLDKTIREDNSLFCQLITKSGADLQNDTPNLLNCDQAIFQQTLQRNLKQHSNVLEKTVDEFFRGLENHIEDSARFKNALSFTQSSPNCSDARASRQASLIHLMLNIDELQPKLLNLLIENFFVAAYDDENPKNKNELPQLILDNLRWINHVSDQDMFCEKVTELLKGSPIGIQKDIIGFIPYILADESHDQISKVLLNLYEHEPELTSSVLDVLSSLILPENRLADIHHDVLKTFYRVKIPNIPIVVKFLLSECPKNVSEQVLSDLRENLKLPGDIQDSLYLSQRNKNVSRKECDDFEMILFVNIKFAVIRAKYLAVSFLKVINDISDDSFKNFDFLLLILLYENFPSRRKSIESILRNNIRKGLSADAFLEALFANHTVILSEYFNGLLSLASTLIRSSELSICTFGAALYKQTFLHLEGFRWEILSYLLSHLGDNDNVRLSTLRVITDLAHQHTETFVKHAILLKGSLDSIDCLNLREAKMIMDNIIYLAHSDKNQSSMEEELAVLVRKQLNHPDIKIKRLGVLGAVLTMKNHTNLDQSSISSDSSFFKGQSELFELVSYSAKDSPLTTALFYDELASNILQNGLDANFEKIIGKKIMDDFETTFIIDAKDIDNFPSDVPMSFQWGVEEEQEGDDSIALNLAGLAIQSQKDGIDCVCTLFPHFRLLRMIESHLNEGSLSNIDALLGCSVIAPKPIVYEKFSSHSVDEQNLALNLLFYTINWFKELINAFATQKDQDLKVKVFHRLKEIVKLQTLLSRLLPLCPSYVPPPAVFDFDVTVPVSRAIVSHNSGDSSKTKSKPSKGKGKKRKSKADEIPATSNIDKSMKESQIDLSATGPSISQAKSKNGASVDLSIFQPHFRELHLDVFNLFYRSPSFDADNSNIVCLSMPEAEFLLNDLIAKLSRVFKDNTKRAVGITKSAAERDVGFSHLDLFSSKEIANQCYRFLKPIGVHLEKISQLFQSLIDENDGIEDAPALHTERLVLIKRTNTLFFKAMKIFFSAPSLSLPDHESPLKCALIVLGKKLEGDATSQMNKDQLVKCCFKYINKFSSSIVCMETAVSQIEVLQALLKLTSANEDLMKNFVEDIECLLKKEWYTTNAVREKGAIYSKHIEELLTMFLKNAKHPVKCIQSFTTDGIEEICKGNEASEKYPTLNKGTLNVFYKCLFENLTDATRKELSMCSKNEVDRNDKEFTVWHHSIKIISSLVGVLKIFSSSVLLTACLKNSKNFLDIFLQFGIPLFDKCLQTRRQDVIVLIKNLQCSTRMLQNACTHSKVKQDLKLINHVPPLKKRLESIIYKVKAMLISNEVSGAFWMGNLKNRDLQGDEILSQASSTPEEAEEGNEEEQQSDVDLEEETDVPEKSTDYDESL